MSYVDLNVKNKGVEYEMWDLWTDSSCFVQAFVTSTH